MRRHCKNVLMGAFVLPGCLAIMPAMANRYPTDSWVSNGGNYSGNIMTEVNGGGVSTTISLEGENITVHGNKTDGLGGGIYARNNMALENSVISDNIATSGGGMYLTGTAGNASLTNVNFSENHATTGSGGAIYFDNTTDGKSIKLYGTNTFTGNTVGVDDDMHGNDIHNLGRVEIVNGETTMDGGITGSSGTLHIAMGGKLYLNNGASIVQDTITLNGQIITTLNTADDYRFTANSFSGTGKLVLTMPELGEYKVFGNAKFSNIDWTEDGLMLDSPIYDVSWSTEDAGTIIAQLKSVEQIAADTHLSMDSAAVISRLIQSDTQVSKELILNAQQELVNGNVAAVANATSAIQPENEAVVQSVATSIQDGIVNMASMRMGKIPSSGRNGGDWRVTTLSGDWFVSVKTSIWGQGLYNKSKQNGAFNSYTRGIAVGVDQIINKNSMIGIGYSFASSDVAGKTHDTDVDTSTLFIYGQYKPSQWFFNGIANYSWSDYSERADVLGLRKTADYDAQSFGLRAGAGYDLKNGISPEFGLRYAHINTRKYTDSFQTTNRLKNTDYLTADFGARYAIDINAFKNLPLRPDFYVGAKVDLFSDKQVANISMPGVDSYSVTGERLARLAGDLGLGLTTNYRGVDMSLMYDLEVRSDYTSQTGRMKFRYKF